MLKANTLKLFLTQNNHLLSVALSILRKNRDLITIQDTHTQALTTQSQSNQNALRAIAQLKKCQFVKRLMNKGFDLTCQSFYCMRRYNKVMVKMDKRVDKVRVRSLKRILDGWVKGMGKALRVLRKWCQREGEREGEREERQRGVLRRILDRYGRVIGLGFEKLVEEGRARESYIRKQLRFVI
jgi:hypothetical protein